MRYDCGGVMGGWVWVFGALLVAGLVLLVVVGGLLVYRATSRPDSHIAGRTGRHPASPVGPGRAREILEERFARGEIDAEEFRDRRRMLDGSD
ncbi:SHOCT domain-containing protein [Rhodococcus opacus]|uniref:SHOCT domain-containing protein n=1 Tax=Rhodococcus opacus TaxID=37919 RepID=UPI00223690CD|nr:SHOCT domain-containing protein [Rhodococcus opacus]UZG59647.1 SHOCT domain-containing protein [Rhodococcus opacus]